MKGEGEGRGGEFAAHVRAPMVGDAAPGAGIEGEGEEEPAFGGFEIGAVALPDEAGPIRRGDFGQPVFGDGMSVAAVGGARSDPRTGELLWLAQGVARTPSRASSPT